MDTASTATDTRQRMSADSRDNGPAPASSKEQVNVSNSSAPRNVRTIEKCAAHGPGWLAVVAVATAGLLTLSALTSQDGLQQTGGGNGLDTEHGSITAIEHRDAMTEGRQVGSGGLAEHGSITAIEHRDSLTEGRGQSSRSGEAR